jgi:predicted metalloprotease with PDZ domain
VRKLHRTLFAVMVATGCSAGLGGQTSQQETLHIGTAAIHVAVDSDLPLAQPVVMEWVRRAAAAVSGYLGRFPVENLSLIIESGGDSAVGDGVTHGASSIRVRLGRHTTQADLDQDWVLTHEMFHLAFPTLKDRYLWMMEGLSDYLEPLARARAGQLTPAQAWREYAEGLPDGLPRPGDHGLDNNHVRERIYWGGNLYWLLADVRIREQTGNRHSLDDVIRAILAAGGNGGANWSLKRVLDMGRKATGTRVLKDLYDQLGPQPGQVDLEALWKRLGVNYHRGTISFDDSAPLAKIRISITAPRAQAAPAKESGP